ncbi:MAG: hypothetical protein E7437_05820 [Ruminococcaceae bacterium]|nr:hypothetical protein [Oscillospiraceae bacterium]
MRFNTHDRTPKIETKKSVKIMLAISFCLIVSLFLFIAIVCFLYIDSVMPAVVILTPVLMLAILIAIVQKDMEKAFIEIVDDVVSVTDYYFGVKKEKKFSMCEIETAEILIGYSMRVRGYRYSNAGCAYIVFRGNDGKYMFKVICVPETKQFFSKYLN